MAYFHVGNLTIPAVWLAALLSLAAASILYRITTRTKISDWYWNGFFLYILVWKGSYLFFNWKMFLEMPLSILYFNGGIKGHILALAAFTVYLVMRARKLYPTFTKEGTTIFLFYWICYEIIINILEKNTMEMIIQIVMLAGLVGFLVYHHKQKLIFSDQWFWFILLVELFVVSFFQPLLSTEVMTFLWVGASVFCAGRIKKKGDFKT